MTGIKVPLWDRGVTSLIGIIAGIRAVVALVDIHVSSLLQIWSGCWFFVRHPNFPYPVFVVTPGRFNSPSQASFVFIVSMVEALRHAAEGFLAESDLYRFIRSFLLQVKSASMRSSVFFVRSDGASSSSAWSRLGLFFFVVCSVQSLWARILFFIRLIGFHRIGLIVMPIPSLSPSACSMQPKSSSHRRMRSSSSPCRLHGFFVSACSRRS